MVSRTEAILNLFETKGSREVWLDRFAASNMSIDTFCEMNHIKKETITKALDEKMSSYREKHPPKQSVVNITDFVEVEAATKPVIDKFQIIDDEPCYEKPIEKIIVKLGKATIEVPASVGKLQLQTILRAVVEL
jgi:hypothetical protein